MSDLVQEVKLYLNIFAIRAFGWKGARVLWRRIH